MLKCYKCKKYNECNKKIKQGTVDCFIEGNPKIQKPCKDCAHYCGHDEKLGDLCSLNNSCAKYTDWFLSQNGWLKAVEPFRKLRAKQK